MSLILKHADLLTRDMLTGLLDEDGGAHVSIYMPTHREWSAVDRDPILLKNLIAEATDKLIETGMRPPTAIQFMREAKELLDRENFWQHQSDGLVLFVANRSLKYFRIPLKLEQMVIVGQRYYLKPLFELFVDDGCFYVLSLSAGAVKLHQCTTYCMREVELLDTSLSLRESVRYDEKDEPQRGLHTGASKGVGGPRGVAVHSAGDEDPKKVRLSQFMHELEPAVREALTHESAPLILVGSASIRAMYEAANRYSHLLEKGVDQDPASLSLEVIHERALAIVKPIFAEARQKASDSFGHFSGPGSMHIAADIESVLSAAYQHRVAKLFLPKGRYVWGRFDAASGAVQVHTDQREGDLELLDLAAAYTLQGNGEIYAVAPGEMPEASSVAAVLRY